MLLAAARLAARCLALDLVTCAFAAAAAAAFARIACLTASYFTSSDYNMQAQSEHSENRVIYICHAGILAPCRLKAPPQLGHQPELLKPKNMAQFDHYVLTNDVVGWGSLKASEPSILRLCRLAHLVTRRHPRL